MIKINVGGWDRWGRIVLGLAILSLAFVGPRSHWAWLGLLPLATGIFRICPAYTACGISTAGKEKETSGPEGR